MPPLLLQPLVENAVTHGIAHLIEGGTIRVSAERRRAPGCASSSRIRAIPIGPARRGAGVGLANVRARLRAMHGADAGLTAGGAHDGLARGADAAGGHRRGIDDRRSAARRHRGRRAAGSGGGPRVSSRTIQESRSSPSARNGFDAVKAVAELQPDLVLLDVQMPKLDGFEVLELIGRDRAGRSSSTAYDQYALRAFEVHAVDYLLKPFSAERFEEALSRARERGSRRRRRRCRTSRR